MKVISSKMRAPDAAQYLQLSASTLAKMRMTGAGPRYAKAGRTVLYDRLDLDAWLAQRTFKSNSDYRSAAQHPS